MDDDSLDDLVSHSPGPDGSLQVGPSDLASDAEESSSGHSGDSEDDTGSEHEDDTDEEDVEGLSEEEDPEDRSGSEDSEDGEEMATATVETQGKLEASSAPNSDDDAESCPICLNAFRGQAVGTPETCAHYFCLDCIIEWSRNANSCPVDRTIFKCICIRAQFNGKILKKIPVENTRACEDEEAEEEDPTFCEVCGRSDREDRLLLCDGCDAGYHMECLDPPLQEVPVDEWFCPECAAPGIAPTHDTAPVSDEEVSLLLADVVPTTSRLRPRVGRTRAIARTRQSERVRATVNRNRISSARRVQHVPRYLMSSLLDETIEAVATGLSTAVYQRPLTPRVPAKRKRKAGRRKKVLGRKKTRSWSSVKSGGTRAKKRQHRVRKTKGRKLKNEVTARSRIARTLGLRRPVHGMSMPSVYKPGDPSLGLMRADIGAASLSLFGDPYELDPFDSNEEQSADPPSPLSAKRRVLSRSALQSHQPVARPVAMGLSRRQLPAVAPEPSVEEAPVPDLLGSILSGQSLLMMSSADVVIHRDGSLSAKRAAPVSLQRNSVTQSREESRPRDSLQPGTLPSGSASSGLVGDRRQSSGLSSGNRAALRCIPACTVDTPVRLDSSVVPRSSQAGNLPNESRPSLKQNNSPQVNGSSVRVGSASCKITAHSNFPSKTIVLGHPQKTDPKRPDFSKLPRIPKIHRDSSNSTQDQAPASGQTVELPSTCISRLTGREGPGQPGRGRAENEPSSRGPQETGSHTGGSRPPAPSSQSSLAPIGPSRGKGIGSSFESFRINIPGNTAHCSQLSSPGFCNTFRPVDSKVQRKENPSPLFSIKKPKQLKSEIYDPFDPTGSDSSPPSSSPESLGSGLLPSEITRTISINSPKAPALQTVRCVTSYRVENIFGTEMEPESQPPGEPVSGMLEFLGKGSAEGASDLEQEGLGEIESTETQGSIARTQRPSPPDPWDDEDGVSCTPFFGSEERTVTCVTVMEPGVPPSPDAPQITTHRIVELRAPSRSRSTSSSRSRKKTKKKKVSREHQRTRSSTRSGSRDRTSRSVSPVTEEHTKRHRAKAKSRRSSSDRASSQDRAKRRRDREHRRSAWGHGRAWRKSRSRSGSPGSSSCERHESRRRKRRHSGSRSRGRDCSPHSSLERDRRHKHRERSRERVGKKESVTRSRERRKWRSRSPSLEHRSRRPRSREKRPHSPEKKEEAVREISPTPAPQEEPRQDGDHPPSRPVSEVSVLPEVVVADLNPPEVPPVLAEPVECVPEDLDYGDSVEAGHVFEDFANEAIFIQLDDMSSPPSPESTDSSSPERNFLPNPILPPASLPQDTTVPVMQREVVPIHREDVTKPTPQALAPSGQCLLRQDTVETTTTTLSTMGVVPMGKDSPLESGRGCEAVRPKDAVAQAPLLRSRTLVKRVTWNLQEAKDSTPALDRVPRTPLQRPQKPQEGDWDAEDRALIGVQQTPFSELPPPIHVLQESGLLDADPSQPPGASRAEGLPAVGNLHSAGGILAQVYSPNMPPPLAQPSSIMPYALVSQPSVQLILQGTLPLAGCGAAQSLAPVPTLPATTSELAVPTTTNNSEEKTAAPKSAAEKTKKEEYMKKLHMQERAVEEVKLAIKPFYQKREVTKEEYKDILRKAVQKICHSKSGEINPVKVANLVKAYVDKYRHMRRHKKAEAGEEPPSQGAET
ncbi:PHD and RING finger domain-containing protein 1 isoform X1 [Psammomys obesus]|uniref:PHD and RING finger domain-containing protein 1 isoform X1 n=1 Tax=Psammomys obesus TaxID=48139 RepID=UPI002452DF53|nr:PHD and RING finger domain-containing protein 1 isoform X1 [Psammomys obesus]XP_055475276.1 PHD and RING finger domain-containing protein 1 isoform X1 [Psammomys obesus]